MKKNFKCDCGNSKFEKSENICLLQPNKENINFNNIYNHNFNDKYCYCNDITKETMYQCINCCDWFHSFCISDTSNFNSSIFENYFYSCQNCLDQSNFLINFNLFKKMKFGCFLSKK
jgi:E3 ubiquitin-protein ligase UBR7